MIQDKTIGLLIEALVDAGVVVGKKKYKERIIEKELNKSLEQYVEQERIRFDISRLNLDFQGLIEYIKRDFCVDLEDALFNHCSIIRGEKRNHIAERAIHYSKAISDNEKKEVTRCILGLVNVIKDFFYKKIDKNHWLLRDDLLDGIREVLSEEFDKRKNELVGISNLSENEQGLLSLADNQEFDAVEGKMHMLCEEISSTHPLYPQYGFSFLGERMISVPRTPDAIINYPPKILIKGEMRIGDDVFYEIDDNVVQYANRHQLDIKLNVQEAKKYLGEYEDPRQYEAERLVGQEVIIKPKAFPPAFPCRIIIDDIEFIEYVALRTEEILDDGTIVISNNEQDNTPFHFTIKIRFGINKESNVVSLTMSMRNANNSDQLTYAKMMYRASQGGYLRVYMYEEKQNLIEGKLDPFNYKSGFVSADEEIDFLERVVEIENYYNKLIELGEEVKKDDYDGVIYLSNLIRGVVIRNTWDELSVEFEYSKNNKNVFDTLEDTMIRIMFSGTIVITIMGEEYELNVCHVCKTARIKNFERLKKKMEYMDEGDKIRIQYIAGDDNTYLEKINTNNLDKKALFMGTV